MALVAGGRKPPTGKRMMTPQPPAAHPATGIDATPGLEGKGQQIE
jgi:hypothetical protein